MPTTPKPAQPEKAAPSTPTKQGYYFPGLDRTIFADSLEEATAIANSSNKPQEE